MEANDGFCRNQVCDDEIASRAVSLMEIQAVVTIEEATRDLDAEKAFQEFNREGMELYSNDMAFNVIISILIVWYLLLIAGMIDLQMIQPNPCIELIMIMTIYLRLKYLSPIRIGMLSQR